LPFALTLVSTVVQGLGRRLLGRRIFKMAPIHYHFQIKNEWSEEKVVMRFALFAFLMSITGVWIFINYN
jgi:phospho-N-acetylmuramoyl-pentapeptide-transferase